MERRIDSISQATNWAHKHHFIVGKTKKTYLSDCENSHEKEQTVILCELKIFILGQFLFATVRVNLSK